LGQPRIRGEGYERAGEQGVEPGGDGLGSESVAVNPAGLAEGQSRDPEEDTGREHLHRRGEQWTLGQRRPSGVERSRSPSARRSDERERGDDVDAASWPHEQGNAAEADDEPQEGRGRETP